MLTQQFGNTVALWGSDDLLRYVYRKRIGLLKAGGRVHPRFLGSFAIHIFDLICVLSRSQTGRVRRGQVLNQPNTLVLRIPTTVPCLFWGVLATNRASMLAFKSSEVLVRPHYGTPHLEIPPFHVWRKSASRIRHSTVHMSACEQQLLATVPCIFWDVVRGSWDTPSVCRACLSTSLCARTHVSTTSMRLR